MAARGRVHRALLALGGHDSPAGSCAWHVLGCGRSVREWALRQGWGGRPVRQEQAQGMVVAALGVLAWHLGYRAAAEAVVACQGSESAECGYQLRGQRFGGSTVLISRFVWRAKLQAPGCAARQ